MDVKTLKEIFTSSGFDLSNLKAEKFLIFMEEIEKWNKFHRLVSFKSRKELVERHFIDSLSLVRCFCDLKIDWKGKHIADVGSGAGFPGIPLKIYLEDFNLTLIESLSKRCSFLEYVKIKLELDYKVICQRAERVREKFHIVVARALGEFESVAPLLEDLSEGFVFILKGKNIKEDWLKSYGYCFYKTEMGGILWKEIF